MAGTALGTFNDYRVLTVSRVLRCFAGFCRVLREKRRIHSPKIKHALYFGRDPRKSDTNTTYLQKSAADVADVGGQSETLHHPEPAQPPSRTLAERGLAWLPHFLGQQIIRWGVFCLLYASGKLPSPGDCRPNKPLTRTSRGFEITLPRL